MLNLNEIKSSYPANLQPFDRFILREYLQHKILQIIFDSNFATNFSFLGGTCLRIVHGNTRFSEDLDFDIFGVSIEIIAELGKIIKTSLEKEGCEVEIQTYKKGAFHCKIRFPNILYKEGISNHVDEKFLIQLDAQDQNFEFTSDKFILNKFDVFTEILCVPKDLLLAQKFYAILNRPRNKGRDFFDVIFLLSLNTKPNYKYLEQKVGISTADQLKTQILEKCSEISMEAMARDVEQFLFNPQDIKKILKFGDYLQSVLI
jgi:predicted nucleotidyltransferase component of viral defense system